MAAYGQHIWKEAGSIAVSRYSAYCVKRIDRVYDLR